MRKAERLFRLIDELRGRRLAVTAGTLADTLGVSIRTVYRDVAALQSTGAPIEGEAGVGYRLDPSYHLPPIMFDPDEVQALLAGLRLAAAATDEELARAGARAETKIRAVLDDQGKARADRSPYAAPFMAEDMRHQALHKIIRKACETRVKLRMSYEAKPGEATERVIWPIALLRWQSVWTFYAWCELRDDFRHFRVGRITALTPLAERFPHHPERTVEALLARMAEEHPEL